MRHVIYPGTFDPMTNGHVDVVERATALFDLVTIGVTTNPAKNPLFSVEERVAIIREVTKGFSNVRVDSFGGLLVDYAQQLGACAIIRGLRAISDFEYEFQMALMNRRLDHSLETVFLMPAEQYTYTSSRLIKEVVRLGGEVGGLVPPVVEERLRKKQAATRSSHGPGRSA